MSQKTRTRASGIALILVSLLFIAGVMASNGLLRGLRLDLTQNKLYTLAQGTRSLLGSIDEPINLYYFYSDEATADIQALRIYANRVHEMLEEFVANADGKLILHEIDPAPFSEDEDRAAEFGLQAVSLGAQGDDVYFGLAATNSVGDEEMIPFFQPREDTFRFLEYDLARLINNLAHPDRTVIGVYPGVPMSGSFDPQAQQSAPPWIVYEQAEQLFELRQLPAVLDRVDEDIDVLWVVHPSGADAMTMYSIDQFVLGGGRALIFVDPMAEIAAATALPAGLPAGASAPTSSDLDLLFDGWGIEYSPTEVVVDDRYALSVSTGGFNARPSRHIGLIGTDPEALDADDIVTSELETLNFGLSGHLALSQNSALQMTPLVLSSPEAAVVTAERFEFLSDPEDLLDNFSPTGEQYVLAARLRGQIDTAFPDGPPGEFEPTEEFREQQIQSTDSANLIVVADVDMLSDRLWAQRQSFLGQSIVSPFAHNGDFVINALDNLSGSAELIGLRSRASFERTFDKVEELRREADAQFRETEEQLELQLAETERRLGELQSSREDQGSLIISPEMEAEIDRFLDEQLRIRRELRAVRHELDRSIERLGTTLKIVNIAGIPLAVTALALALVALRRRRKKQP